MPNIYDDPRQYITPYQFSRAALDFMRQHKAAGRRVFTEAYEKVSNARCKNCQGHEVLLIKPIESGPYGHSPDGQLATWFDGNEESGPGWYVIRRTSHLVIGSDPPRYAWIGGVNFACPVCQLVDREVKRDVEAEVDHWATDA